MARQRLDADRLAAAYERDGRRLLVFFTRRTYDAQLAVDLVAETYARAFEQRRRFAADATDHDALAGWVFGIGRNVLHEALRRGRAERRALARLGVHPPALEAEAPATARTLRALAAGPRARPRAAGARLDGAGHPRRDLGPRPRAAARRRAAARLVGSPANGRAGLCRGGRGARRRVRLTASACDYGQVRAVGVFLTVPGGGGGARCDVASRRPGLGVSPSVLARRLVQTYFDPVSGRTWAFGALPAAARTVDVTSAAARTRVAATPADPDAVARAACAGMRVFVAVLDGPHDVPLVTARDAAGAALLVCREGRCAPPAQGGTP